MKGCILYFLGDLEGSLVKPGHTKGDLRRRIRQVEKELNRPLVLLAAVHGQPTHEDTIKKGWRRFADEGFIQREEVFHAEPEITEYINWLRRQWWVTLEPDDVSDAVVEADRWLPRPERRVAPPPQDDSRLLQVDRSFTGSLAGTTWDWMSTPVPSVEGDYYTPPEIVWDGAAKAMGGIDLDVSSHWLANRRLQIPDYFDLNRSAFEHDWYGRIWNNAPFGNNAPWFERTLHFWNRGEIEQVCMLAPAWAFIYQIARPFMEASSAWCLLSPTPKFWGNSAGRDGSNHPHMVIYLGPRSAEFCAAFNRFGHTAARLPFTADPLIGESENNGAAATRESIP